MASKKTTAVAIFMAASLCLMMMVIAREIEKSSDVHAGGVHSCRKYCGRRCCTEEEIRNLEHNSKVKPDAQKPKAVTLVQNDKTAEPNHHGGGGGGGCYKYCGHHCCTEKEIHNLEHNSKMTEEAQKSEAATVGNNEAAKPNHHGGGGGSCYKHCGHHCCSEEEIRDLKRNQKETDAQKPEAATPGRNNEAIGPNHHGGGGGGCYKYCGHHCCSEEEIHNLRGERNGDGRF